MDDIREDLKPERIRWLPPLVLLVNSGMVGLMVIYTLIGLKPVLPPLRLIPAFASGADLRLGWCHSQSLTGNLGNFLFSERNF